MLVAQHTGVVVSSMNSVAAWHAEQQCSVLLMVQKAAVMSASGTTSEVPMSLRLMLLNNNEAA